MSQGMMGDESEELEPVSVVSESINDFATTAAMMGPSCLRCESLSQTFDFLGGGLHRHAANERI